MSTSLRFPSSGEYHDDVDDDDIRGRLRAGDVVALQLLRQRHGEAMHDACFKILHHDSHAEDAVADALLLAWRYRDRVASADSVRSYVVQIGRNVAYDVIRKAARRRGLERANAASLEPDGAVDAAGIERAAHAALVECLDAIGDTRTRLALTMRISEDRPWAEVAEALAPPLEAVDTMRMRVKRALRALRACLASKGVTQ